MRFSVWRFFNIWLGFAAAIATTGPVLAQDLAGDGVNLAMRLSASAPDQALASAPDVSSQADLTGQLPGLETKVELGMKVGQAAPGVGAPDPGWWNSTAAGVNAAWTPFSAAKFEFGAQNATRVQYSASDPVFSDGTQHYAESRQSGLSAGATLTPLPPVDVTVNARLSSNVQQDAWIGGTGGQTSDLTQSDIRQLSARLAFTPLSMIKLEAGGQLQSMALSWSGGRAATYAALDPSAGLSATPWAGGSLRLSLDRATAPLSIDQFIGFGQGAVALEAVQPNREWRYSAALTQKAGPLDLKASVLQARVETFAYLSAPATAARMGSGMGDRSEVSAGMAAPVPVPGLQPFKLEAEATFRASAVQDPLTGMIGRMSGERPYDASLSLSQAVGKDLRWGVSAKASGPQTNLGPTETASLSSTAGLGGFLQYSARPVTVRLSLDNLLGGERAEHDVYYAGARDLSEIDHAGDTRIVDRAIHISLIRPL